MALFFLARFEKAQTARNLNIEVAQLKEFGIETHENAKTIIPVKSNSKSTAIDGYHLVSPCARAQ